MFGLGGRYNNAQDCWNNMGLTFKFFFISSLAIQIISLFLPICVLFIDIPILTIFSFNIWRPFFSFWGNSSSAFALINILFAFLWLMSIMSKDKSTVKEFMNVIFINLEIHLLLNLLTVLFIFIFQKYALIVGYGWFPIVIVYEFERSAINPDESRQFCCLPFKIKNKHFPWVILLFLTLFSQQFLCMVIAGIVGYLEGVVLKRRVINPSQKFYSKIEKCLPVSLKQRPDYTLVTTNASQSEGMAPNAGRRNANDPGIYANPFNSAPNARRNQQEPKQVKSSIKSDSGVKIGGQCGQFEYKNMWKMKQLEQQKENQSKQKENKEKEEQIQSTQVQQKKSPKKVKNPNQYVELNEESSQNGRQNSDDLI